MSQPLSLRNSAAPALAAVIGRQGRISKGFGRKLSDRERHRAEERARIILLCRNAFLVGNDVFARADEIFGGANETNDRKDPEGNEQNVATRRAIGERSVEAAAQCLGNVRASAAATAAARRVTRALLNDLRLKNDRIDRFYSCPFVGTLRRYGVLSVPKMDLHFPILRYCYMCNDLLHIRIRNSFERKKRLNICYIMLHS